MTVKKINTTKYDQDVALAAVEEFKRDLAFQIKILLDNEIEDVLDNHNTWDNAEEVVSDLYCDNVEILGMEAYIRILNYFGYKYEVKNETNFISTVKKQA